MLSPNGILTSGPDGYVWSTGCRKCGTSIKINLGTLTLDEAHKAVTMIDRTPRECPGFHVELTGWTRLWSLDLMLCEYEAALAPKAEPVGTFLPVAAGWPSDWQESTESQAAPAHSHDGYGD